MKRSFGTAALCIALAGLLAAPASGAVDSNPNALELVGVSCPEAGLFFETIWVASQSSLAGHDLDGKTVGVAKSLYVTDSEGDALAVIWDRSGKGLSKITVWCFWADGESPTGFVGGDVLFSGHGRP